MTALAASCAGHLDPQLCWRVQLHSSTAVLCFPTGPKGWSKVVVGEPADPAVGPTPGEAQRSAAAAAQAKEEEDDMQAAIQVIGSFCASSPDILPAWHTSQGAMLSQICTTPALA